MKKIILILILLFFCIPGISQAVFINFDDLDSGNINGVNLGGVTFTGSGNDATIIDGNQNSSRDNTGGYISPDNTISTPNFITETSLTMTFDPGVYSVSFFGGDSGGDEDRFFVDVYGLFSNHLSTIDTGFFGGNAYVAGNFMQDNYQVIISGLGEIGSVVIRNAAIAGILIDDLEFQPVHTPEPATMFLLGTGLIGVAGVARRRKKKQI